MGGGVPRALSRSLVSEAVFPELWVVLGASGSPTDTHAALGPKLPSEIGTPGSQRLTPRTGPCAGLLPFSPSLSPSCGVSSAPPCQTPAPIASALLIWPPDLLPATLKHPRLENWRVSASPYPAWLGVLAAWANYLSPPASALSSSCCPEEGPRTLFQLLQDSSEPWAAWSTCGAWPGQWDGHGPPEAVAVHEGPVERDAGSGGPTRGLGRPPLGPSASALPALPGRSGGGQAGLCPALLGSCPPQRP